MTTMLAAARELACLAHAGQRYSNKPYVQHLEDVVALLAPYGETAMVVGWLHDILEDTRRSTRRRWPTGSAWLVAHAVGLVTDEPGGSRTERKAKTYAKLAAVAADAPEAVALVVKLADRLANVRASARNNPRLLAMYRAEHPAFRAAVWRPAVAPELWAELDGHILA